MTEINTKELAGAKMQLLKRSQEGAGKVGSNINVTLASTSLLIIDDILVYILIFDVSAAVALGNERRDEIGPGRCQVQTGGSHIEGFAPR